MMAVVTPTTMTITYDVYQRCPNEQTAAIVTSERHDSETQIHVQ
jgi:hypothetical protein